ncbi:hypothetical protein [Nostoc sp.]
MKAIIKIKRHPICSSAIAKLEGLIAAPLEDIRRYSILAAIA